MPPGRHAAPGGWYPDPVNPANERYWDGWQWSRNTRPSENPAAGGHTVGSSQPYGQPYPQAPGQHPYGSNPYGSQPYGQPYGQAPGQPPDGQAPGQQPYGGPGQQPYGPNPYGSNQYGQPYPNQAVAQPYGGKPVPTTADGVPLAGWWWRALAVVIDALIVGTVSSLLTFPIYRRMVQAFTDYFTAAFEAAGSGAPIPPQPSVTDMISSTDQLTLLVVGLVVHTLYIVLFLRWRGATPGKMAVGLRVVPVDEGRSTAKLTWSAVTIRALFWTVPNLWPMLIVVRVIDVLMPLWNPKRQALHDVVAKTQVVKIR